MMVSEDPNQDAEFDAETRIEGLVARYWDLANSPLPNGIAMMEMARILKTIAGLTNNFPHSIVYRLRPEDTDLEAFGTSYLAVNLWLYSLKFGESNLFYPVAYVEGRDRLEEGKTSQLKVRDLGEAGKGLFTLEKIKKGEKVFVCSGKREVLCSPYESKEVVEHVEVSGDRGFSLRPRNPNQLYPNAICIGQEELGEIVGLRMEDPMIKANIWLDPSPECPLRFLNHSCEPNLKRTADALTFIAMYDIEPGEQLTCDYSTLEVNPNWEMECKCGSPKCRGTIGGIQSLPTELLEQYGTDLPQFMLDLFKESHRGLNRDVHEQISLTRWMTGVNRF